MSLDLSQLAGEGDELVERIGGMTFRFSELPLGSLARLQAWIRENVPHPLAAIKPHLDGLSPEERAALLESARREAMDWPPQIGTSAGAMALLGAESGQIEVFYEGLRVHHPEATRDDAATIYRVLKKEVSRESRRATRAGGDDSPRVRRLYATLFGTGGVDDDESPKDPAPTAGVASNGRPSSVAVSAS